jgi:hypothetical protein
MHPCFDDDTCERDWTLFRRFGAAVIIRPEIRSLGRELTGYMLVFHSHPHEWATWSSPERAESTALVTSPGLPVIRLDTPATLNECRCAE